MVSGLVAVGFNVLDASNHLKSDKQIRVLESHQMDRGTIKKMTRKFISSEKSIMKDGEVQNLQKSGALSEVCISLRWKHYLQHPNLK